MNAEFGNLNVCLVGIITSYNSEKGICSIQPQKGVIKGEVVDLPVLVNVPMFQIGTLEFAIRMDFKPGDIVPIVIADYDIQNILLSGTIGEPNVNDYHNLNDAIALPIKLNSFNSILPSNDPGDMVIQKRDGSSKIVIKATTNEIVIESDSIKLGENATQAVKLADNSNATKVFAE